jgi:hypothetical protein
MITNSTGQGRPVQQVAEKFLPVKERKDPMSEHFIYSIGKWNGEPPLGSASFPEHYQPRMEPNANLSAQNSMSSFPGNTHLIFEVNESDNSIVVMIVDEASSKVIRTVPGDAINDIPSGGLLQKNA